MIRLRSAQVFISLGVHTEAFVERSGCASCSWRSTSLLSMWPGAQPLSLQTNAKEFPGTEAKMRSVRCMVGSEILKTLLKRSQRLFFCCLFPGMVMRQRTLSTLVILRSVSLMRPTLRSLMDCILPLISDVEHRGIYLSTVVSPWAEEAPSCQTASYDRLLILLTYLMFFCNI